MTSIRGRLRQQHGWIRLDVLACRRARLDSKADLPVTTADLLRQSVASLVVAAVFALIYLAAARAGHRFITRMALKGEPGARAATLWSVVRRLLVIVLVVTGFLTVASAVWDLPLTPFIALGSAVGIAIGFGAQQLIQDVVAGFFLLLEDQYRIGDSVTLAGTSGVVEEIRLRVTVLRDVGGNVHYIPNGEIRLATNMTRDFAQVVLDVAIGFEADVDRVIAILGEEATSMAEDSGWEDAFLGVPEVLGIDRISESGVVVRVTAKVRPAERWRVQREALRRIKKRLDLEEIVLPWNPVRFYRKDDGGSGGAVQ